MASEDGGPAFPNTGILKESDFAWMNGMSIRQCAAITLRVPNSGTDWLDAMIRESLRDEFAAKAMQATQISEVMEAFRRNDYEGRQSHNAYSPINTCKELAEEAYRIADAMLKAREIILGIKEKP